MKKIQQEILSNKKIYVGLEDSKKTWKLCVRNEGMIVFRGGIPAEYSNLKNFFLNKFPGCDIEVIYEAGFSGFWLYDLLMQDNIHCVVTPPNKVTEEKCNKVKTDKIDARRLAIVLENGDYKSCRVPTEKRMKDRQLSRLLFQVHKKIISTKNQIRRFFDVHGIVNLPKGTWTDSYYKKLKDLKLDETLKFCLDCQLEVLDTLRKQRVKLYAKLKELYQSKDYKKDAELLKSLPGVGWFTAIRLILEWGDISEFISGKKFASYNGLCPSEYSTGESIKRGGITKQGNRLSRHWLIEASWAAIRKDPVLLDKFKRVWKHSGHKNIAIVAVARKMAVRMRDVISTGTPYQLGLVEEIR